MTDVILNHRTLIADPHDAAIASEEAIL